MTDTIINSLCNRVSAHRTAFVPALARLGRTPESTWIFVAASRAATRCPAVFGGKAAPLGSFGAKGLRLWDLVSRRMSDAPPVEVTGPPTPLGSLSVGPGEVLMSDVGWCIADHTRHVCVRV